MVSQFHDWIQRLQQIFPKPIEVIGDRIVVKNLDNSTVHIGTQDMSAIQTLRSEIADNHTTLFDTLISEIRQLLDDQVSTHIKHLYTIDDLKRLSKDTEFLFDNDLAFFTKEETEGHILLLKNLTVNRLAFLSGYPATGKSISVVKIAQLLEQKYYTTYYYSFKKSNRWAEVWDEMLRCAAPQTVFVLDDIHLDIESATEALIKLKRLEDLNILFISRETRQRSEFEYLNIYTELAQYEVKTEQPSVYDKAAGIVRNFQSFYQKKNSGRYMITDISYIVKKTYRNLVALREYLKFWEAFPDTPLNELDDNIFYKSLYQRYFRDQNVRHNTERLYLQYVVLYYFEISFYPNPQYLKETDELALNPNNIIDDGYGTYSIYHGEYCFLLLKAYKSLNPNEFLRKHQSWELFFATQLSQYIHGFIANNQYPSNILQILNIITGFTKKRSLGIDDAKYIFENLVNDPQIKEWLLEYCKNNPISSDTFTLLYNIIETSDLIKPFLEALQNHNLLFRSKPSFGLYISMVAKSHRKNLPDIDWIDNYFQPHFDIMITHSSLQKISSGLNVLSKTDLAKAQIIYKKIDKCELILKFNSSPIHQISTSLLELKSLDLDLTKQLYQSIHLSHLTKSLKSLRIHEIAGALDELNKLDPEGASKLYETLTLDQLIASSYDSTAQSLAQAIVYLNKIHPSKTTEYFNKLNFDKVKKLLSGANIKQLSHSLDCFRRVDLKSAIELYHSIPLDSDKVTKYFESTALRIFREVLYQLNNIDPLRTKRFYKRIDLNSIKVSIQSMNLHDVYSDLIKLDKIDVVMTKRLYDQISLNDLVNSANSMSKHKIRKTLNNLFKMNRYKTSLLINELDRQ